MTTLPDQLTALLSSVRTPGDFWAAGTSAMLLPRLDVQGVGPIAFPLLPSQAAQLITVAERAPYGRGGETLVDTAVRRTWQIGPDRFSVEGKHWARSLAAVVERVAAGLGVNGTVLPELYKLLVYDEGSFFVSHRDTEKAPGMFATLIIALPSLHAGGELLVRHQGREVRLELQGEDPSEAAFAAFYADCVHEVLPVTSGCRLALVYNLLLEGPSAMLPRPPNYEAEQAGLAALLQRWSGGTAAAGEATPEKLVYLLEHAYTPAELSFATLKGADAAAAAVLAAAAAQAGCDLHAALLTIEENGSAYESGPNEYEIVEVCDRDARLSGWQRPGGEPSALQDLPLLDSEICPAGALDEIEPDDEYFQEATGNEGASFDRTYRRAALVLWPVQRRLAVLNQGGLAATLPCLTDLADQWLALGEGVESRGWQQAHELSGHMLRSWPEGYTLRRGDNAPSEVGEMLAQLARLKDTLHIDAFVTHLASADHPGGAGDNEALLQALGCLAPERAGERIAHIVAARTPRDPGSCADLLARAAAAGFDAQRLASAARGLIEALPDDDAAAAQAGLIAQYRVSGPRLDAGFVADLLTALVRIDAGLAERAAERMLARPAAYVLDAVILPAVRSLVESPQLRAAAAVQRLHAACLAHLQARAALPLAPPADWSRAAELSCRCQRCAELAHFLASPELQRWTCKAAEHERSHLEASIRQDACDVDCVTERRGRPYSLVCTKNQASYERRTQQRTQDLADLARLE